MHITPDLIVYWQHGVFRLNATIVMTWALMLLLVGGSALVTRRLSHGIARSRWQNLLEVVVTGISGQIGEVGLASPAQLLNFGVLIVLMKRFLYRPVLAAIDARERQVAAVLADAEAKKAEARDERAALDARNAAFAHDRAALWATANADAQTERKRLLDAAGQAADALSAHRRDALRHEAAAFHQTIGLQAQQEVFAIARQTLADLADSALEDRICTVFIDRLRALDGPARERWAEAARAEPGPLQVRSAFVLPEPLRAALRDAVRQALAADVPLQFDLAPGLVAGIELTAGDQRLDWSIAGQVDALARRVAEWVAPPLPASPAADRAATSAAPTPVAPPEAVAA